VRWGHHTTHPARVFIGVHDLTGYEETVTLPPASPVLPTSRLPPRLVMPPAGRCAVRVTTLLATCSVIPSRLVQFYAVNGPGHHACEGHTMTDSAHSCR
jgi:hypothetical protein